MGSLAQKIWWYLSVSFDSFYAHGRLQCMLRMHILQLLQPKHKPRLVFRQNARLLAKCR